MEEQLSATLGDMIQLMSKVVLRDIATDEPHFLFFDSTIRLVQRHLAIAQAFYLATGQHDPTLERIENKVVMPRFAILRDDLLILFVTFG